MPDQLVFSGIAIIMNKNICTFLLLLLSLALPILSDKCPDHGKLPTTCKCGDDFVDENVDAVLLCGGSSLWELEDALSVMDKSSGFMVKLDNMKIGNLPSRIFHGWNVVKLDISHCEMDGLAPPGEIPLQGLEETLNALIITSSFTEEERPTVLQPLSHLRSLKELELSHNAITELSDDWFSTPPPALSYFTLFNNGIEKLGDRAFEKLTNLEFLRLEGNRFGPIKRSMLPRPADKLEVLKLTNNAFTSLPDDLFTDMPALTVLSIKSNGITHVQEGAFKPIWSKLGVIDTRGNPLECDSSMEWMFHAKTKAGMILGTCQGPLGREGMDLQDFIETKGRGE